MLTNAELLSLLRESRNALSQGCWNGSCCEVRARIDAALAEHADSATPVVESVAPSALPEVESDGFWRDEIYRNSVHRCGVLIRRDGLANWYWSVSRTFDGVNVGKGCATTLDEAKSAAIAAARGLR